MKISTNQMFNNSTNQLVTAQSKVAEMQAQLATGTKLVKASDEPQLAAVVLRLETAVAEHESFQRNLRLVDERLALEESIVLSVDNILTRIQELAVQGASDTVADTDRQYIGAEVKGLRDALVGLANSQDNEGRYLFAGSQSGSAAYRIDNGGQVSYAGDLETLKVNIASNRSIQLNKPGPEVFGSVTIANEQGVESNSSFFDVIDDLISALDTGDTTGVSKGIGSIDLIHQKSTLALVSIGVTRSNIELELDVHEEAKITLESVLSREKDVDYSVLVTELSAQMVGLEALQSSFAKIAQMTLFDYLR